MIIAGGSGTRFWPKSTHKCPKQFLSFGDGEGSLLYQTLDRFHGWIPSEQQLVVTTKALEIAVNEHIKDAVNVLAEPMARNTAACIYWAARFLGDRDRVMLVMPADHLILDRALFKSTLEKAADWARKTGDLVTLGVTPNRPETGFGYLRTRPLDGGALRVEAFIEKPDRVRAEQFLAEPGMLWNAGIFVWKVGAILDAFDRYMPEFSRSWDACGGDIDRLYQQLPSISIDYAIMEKADNVVSFPLSCGWDDVGSWSALEGLAGIFGKQQGSNVVMHGECLALEATGTIVDASESFVARVGVQDLIVVRHGTTVLVAHKEKAQDVRALVEQIRAVRPDLV